MFYNDYLLVLYSTAISVRFEQIAKRIQTRTTNDESSKIFWRYIRADYIRLAKLCRKLNKYISLNVLMSFTGNVFLILATLFLLLR